MKGTSLIRPQDLATPRTREQALQALHSRAPRNADALAALAATVKKPQPEPQE